MVKVVKDECKTRVKVKKTYKVIGDKHRMVVEYICKDTGHKLRERDMPVRREELENEELLQEKLNGVLRGFEKRREREKKKEEVRTDPNPDVVGFELDSYVEN